jgi:hypothetical protein
MIALKLDRPNEGLPPVVAWLGYGGLLPFVGLALLILLDAGPVLPWEKALIAYGAVILSFVGALHWGLAMALPELTVEQRRQRFVWSIVPALVAWSALLLAPVAATALLITGFIAHYWQDRRLAGQAGLPFWYLPLRLRLSGVACLSLLASLGSAF